MRGHGCDQLLRCVSNGGGGGLGMTKNALRNTCMVKHGWDPRGCRVKAGLKTNLYALSLPFSSQEDCVWLQLEATDSPPLVTKKILFASRVLVKYCLFL